MTSVLKLRPLQNETRIMTILIFGCFFGGETELGIVFPL